MIDKNMNFSTQIKQRNTDEWYTPVEPVRMIVPYLKERGYLNILCPFDKEDSNLSKSLISKALMLHTAILRLELTFLLLIT